jgi:hypothetical protein
MAHLTGSARLQLSPGVVNAKCKIQDANADRDQPMPGLHFEF